MTHGINWRVFPRNIPGWILRAFDPYVHALTVMNHEHRMIHDGMSFHTTHRVAALAAAGTLDLLFAVPAGSHPHLQSGQFSLGSGDCDIAVYEDTTTSADGTVLSSFNRNRNSTNTPSLVVSHTPTVTGVGTLIHDRLVPPTGSGVGNSAGFVSPNLGEEWILKPSTKYLVRLTNNSGGIIKVGVELLWYEPSYIDDEPA